MVDAKPLTLNLDPNAIREIVGTAVRRASAFMSLALHKLDANEAPSFEIAAGMTFRFWPENIPDEVVCDTKKEYRNWVIGACFRELEQHYSLFLDQVGTMIEISDAHGTNVPFGTAFGTRYAKISNIAAKQREISNLIGGDDHFEELNSISLARNSLAHNLGIVRVPRDCNNDNRDSLTIKWLGMDMIFRRGGVEIVAPEVPFDTNELPGEGDTEVAVRTTMRELRFNAGDRIELSDAQLSELCFFYTIVANKTVDGLIKHLLAKGIPAAK